jgi:tripartite ATP-independent transporter DctM subunit
MLIPIMHKSGYDKEFSVAITVTSSCQGVLIPPSHNMIFYAMASGGVSVAQLFVGGLIPGVMLGLGLMVYVAILSVRKKYPKGGKATLREAIRISRDAFFGLFTAFIILGGVTLGWFTATESAAVACIYALLVSFFIYRELTVRDIPRILASVSRTLTISFSLIAAAGAFGWMNAYLQVPKLIAGILMGISSNPHVILLLILLMLLVLGCVMDMAPLIFICTPILLPVVKGFGMSPVHFGVTLIFALAVGLCTPPVGSALFVGCAVGKISIESAVKAMWPQYLVMIAVLFLVAYFPALTLWLPAALM